METLPGPCDSGPLARGKNLGGAPCQGNQPGHAEQPDVQDSPATRAATAMSMPLSVRSSANQTTAPHRPSVATAASGRRYAARSSESTAYRKSSGSSTTLTTGRPTTRTSRPITASTRSSRCCAQSILERPCARMEHWDTAGEGAVKSLVGARGTERGNHARKMAK